MNLYIGLGIAAIIVIIIIAIVTSSGSSTTPPPPSVVPAYVPGTLPGAPTWTPFYGNQEAAVDLGQPKSDELFSKSLVIKRDCPGCADGQKTTIYKRITAPPTGFSLYNNVKNTWTSVNNALNKDFSLFSTEDDARSGANAWNFCNYDDAGIGGFRDCGKTGAVGGQWNSVSRGGQKVTYSVLNVPT